MRTIFYYDMYARHDVIIKSACSCLEDEIQINLITYLSVAAGAAGRRAKALAQTGALERLYSRKPGLRALKMRELEAVARMQLQRGFRSPEAGG